MFSSSSFFFLYIFVVHLFVSSCKKKKIVGRFI